MKVLLVYNPQAGHGRAKKLLPEVEAEFNRQQLSFDLALTDYPEHGIRIVKETDFTKYDAIVAAGGDGTLFEVINGYYQNPDKNRIPLGILPVGTGNAFVRDMNLDNTRWKEAIGVIASGKTKGVDVGKFTTHGQTYYYLNILGLGFVADVTEIAHKLKIFGNLSYTLGVLYRTLFLKSNQLTIKIDGKQIIRDSTFIEISNTRYTSNFLMAPAARIDDGLFDVTLVSKLTRIKLLQSFPKIFTGDHVHMDECETIQARHISIDSDQPKVLTPDGELVGITPVEIECIPQAIEVFWQ